MGEKESEPFQFTFNGLDAILTEHLRDSRHGLNTQFPLADLLRQSIYSRLAGYEDLNDAARLSTDPTFRLIGSPKRWDRSAALTSTLHWFETELLTREENLVGLMAVNRDVIGRAETCDRCDRIVLDMDSSESLVHGQQEGSAYNGHFETVCYHPLFLFNDHGDCLAAKLRPGNVSSTDDWEELLVPEIDRQQASGLRVAFRADAAFARPEICEALEARGVQYAIRIPANKNLELAIEDVLFRSPGRPSRTPPVRYRSFHYQADSWTTPRRVVPKSSTTLASCSRASVHRDQSPGPESRGRAVLQQARHRGTVDQGRQAGSALDTSVVPPLPGQRGPAATERPRVQPRESLAAAGAAGANRHLVAHQSSRPRQDGWAAGETCSVLLAPAGGEPSDAAFVRVDAPTDLGLPVPTG